ncbi:4-hydroxythreonine-4-phosphate dehydrogenase PdxA [bacterium]|nr:MAG: 4-hydroxythreonine-4-phosphate dehydrogenase PdxA [bacterium]
MPSSKSFPVKLVITLGDPSGIGPEITAKALSCLKPKTEIIIVGDKWVFNKARKAGRIAGNIRFIDLNNVSRRNFSFGKIKPEYGRASIEYLEKALELIGNKEADALVTCPISKEAASLSGFAYSGHTEYLLAKTKSQYSVMMLLNNYLKISLVTTHIPISEVPSRINKQKIIKTIILTHSSLKNLFGIKNPRVVVCGINPHASDNGLIGSEENKIIKPALSLVKKSFKGVEGPMPSDTAVAKAMQGYYDAVIAMYHDQALIPLKLSDPKSGVNITLGLPFVRTSPLHGTAFDIAGSAKADPASLVQAIKLAAICQSNLKRD